MYHSQKDSAHILEPSTSIYGDCSDSVRIEDVPYSEEEMALLRLLAKRQEEEFMSTEE